jgi:predicted nuclease of predicted toxin-antitoxin system
VKFLVDAQLPARLARHLIAAGHDARHTSDLPNANRTSDAEICLTADAEERVVVTKDRDLRDSHLLRGSPRRLLVIATGNITNNELLSLIEANLGEIEAALDEAAFVELASDRLIVHGRG